MKHTLKTILITIVLVLSAIHNIAFAQTTRTVLQEQFGKQTITVGSNETITFYDPWGENGIFEYGRHNSHSLAVFTPESNDMAVVISFEYVDMHGKVTIDDEDGEIDVYEGEINIYDGDADPDN